MKISLRSRHLESFDIRNPKVFGDEEIRSKLALVKSLDLSQNQLNHLGGLQPFVNLTFLDLSSNYISSLKQLPPSLNYLNVSYNSLSSLEGVSCLQRLQRLDISHNNIRDVRELPCDSLIELNLSHNKIRDVSGIELCQNLMTLNISHNYLSSVESVCSRLQNLSKLRIVHFSHNPMTSAASYYATLARALPNLELLDGAPIPRPALMTGLGRSRTCPAKKRVHVSFSDTVSVSTTDQNSSDTTAITTQIPRNSELRSRPKTSLLSAKPMKLRTPSEQNSYMNSTDRTKKVKPILFNQGVEDCSVQLIDSNLHKRSPHTVLHASAECATRAAVPNPNVSDTSAREHSSHSTYPHTQDFATVSALRQIQLLEVRLEEVEKTVQQKSDRVVVLERENRRLESELRNTRRLLSEQMERSNRMKVENASLQSMVSHLRTVADKNAAEFKYAHAALARSKERDAVSNHSKQPQSGRLLYGYGMSHSQHNVSLNSRSSNSLSHTKNRPTPLNPSRGVDTQWKGTSAYRSHSAQEANRRALLEGPVAGLNTTLRGGDSFPSSISSQSQSVHFLSHASNAKPRSVTPPVYNLTEWNPSENPHMNPKNQSIPFNSSKESQYQRTENKSNTLLLPQSYQKSSQSEFSRPPPSDKHVSRVMPKLDRRSHDQPTNSVQNRAITSKKYDVDHSASVPSNDTKRTTNTSQTKFDHTSERLQYNTPRGVIYIESPSRN